MSINKTKFRARLVLKLFKRKFSNIHTILSQRIKMKNVLKFSAALVIAALFAGCASESSRVVETPKVASYGSVYNGKKSQFLLAALIINQPIKMAPLAMARIDLATKLKAS